MLNSRVIREKTQRLQMIQGGFGIHQCIFRTPKDPNPACDLSVDQLSEGPSVSPQAAVLGAGGDGGGAA